MPQRVVYKRLKTALLVNNLVHKPVEKNASVGFLTFPELVLGGHQGAKAVPARELLT
jgi:hypothetical protein